MQNYNDLAASVKISDDKKYSLLDADPSLTLIGKGRSAYVFRIHSTNKALKVFSRTKFKQLKWKPKYIEPFNPLIITQLYMLPD